MTQGQRMLRAELNQGNHKAVASHTRKLHTKDANQTGENWVLEALDTQTPDTCIVDAAPKKRAREISDDPEGRSTGSLASGPRCTEYAPPHGAVLLPFDSDDADGDGGTVPGRRVIPRSPSLSSAAVTLQRRRPVTPPLRAVVSPGMLTSRSQRRGEEMDPIVMPPARLRTPDDAAVGDYGHSEECSPLATPAVEDTARVTIGRPEDPFTLLSTDSSGFCNAGNDCYACSVLTLLIRNRLFSEALAKALPEEIREIGEESFRCFRTGALPRWDSEGVLEEMRNHHPIHLALYGFLVELRKRRYLLQQTVRVRKGGYRHQLPEYGQMIHRLFGFGDGVQEVNLDACVASRSFYDFQRGISLNPLKDALGKECVFLCGYQEDAHEFLIFLLDCLEREAAGLCRSPVGAGLGSEQSIRGDRSAARARIWINRLVQGKMLNIVRCRNEGCGHEILTEEPFVNIGLSLPSLPTGSPTDNETLPEEEAHPPHIQEMMDNTLAFEALEGYRCDRCQKAVNQYQGACFLGTPPLLLTAQIKRFNTSFDRTVNAVVLTKNQQPINIREELELYFLQRSEAADELKDRNAGVCETYPENKVLSPSFHEAEGRTGATVSATKVRYRLQAVLQHHGTDIEHGHYTCCFTRRTHRDEGELRTAWFQADDKMVSELKLSAVRQLLDNSTRCYLLLYELEDSQFLPHCPLESVMPWPSRPTGSCTSV